MCAIHVDLLVVVKRAECPIPFPAAVPLAGFEQESQSQFIDKFAEANAISLDAMEQIVNIRVQSGTNGVNSGYHLSFHRLSTDLYTQMDRRK